MNKKKKIPALRFPEFQNSGEWEEKKLGGIAQFLKGKGLSKTDIVDGGKYPCIHYGELFTYYSEVIKKVDSFTNLKEGVYSISNDVLMPTSDVTPNGLAKSCCIKLSKVFLGNDILIIRTSPKEIKGDFLSRLIRFEEREVLKYVSGTTVFHLYASSIEKLNIYIPSLPEQQKIADCLSSLDDLIDNHSEKLALLEKHKKGLMQKLFPREGQKVPELRFPEFQNDGECEEKRLGEIGEPLMCKRIFKEQTIKNSKIGIPFYKVGTFGKEADSFIPIEIYEDYKNKYSFPRIGEILISASGTIGRLVVYDGKPAYFQDSNIVWIGNNEKQIVNSFLFYCYSNLKWQTSDGGVIRRLYNSDLKNLDIRYPQNKKEQQKIADCLSSLDELITTQREKIEQLKQHKKGLMQGLFVN